MLGYLIGGAIIVVAGIIYKFRNEIRSVGCGISEGVKIATRSYREKKKKNTKK